jgi:hypothetical protein
MSAWAPNEERQYDHIKEGYEDRGVDHDRAQEIASRTVNKERREAGERPNSRTEGTGSPTQPLEARTRDELENRARALGIRLRRRMRKDELVDAIHRAEG